MPERQHLKVERRTVENLAFYDKSGAMAFPPPEGRRSRMVFADWGAAPPERPLTALPEMFQPLARPIGRGDRDNPAGLEDARELLRHHRRILDMLDDLVRGDEVEDRIRERQALQRRLIEDSAAGIRPSHSVRQRNRRDIDAIDTEPRRQASQIGGLDPVPQPASSKLPCAPRGNSSRS